MYSAGKVDEFELKDVCFQFMINVSRQGNNVKIKTVFKNKFAEIAILSFCKANDNTPEKQLLEVFCKKKCF